MLRVNHIMPRSRAQGPGLRYTIWTQGCSIHCSGCLNKDTWSFSAGFDKDIKSIVNEILNDSELDGVTITGGEPLDQYDSVYELCSELFAWIPIFITTGYTIEQIWDNKKHSILDKIDMICAGPFEQNNIYSGEWKGSSNQVISYFTVRGGKQGRMPVVLREFHVGIDGNAIETGFSIPPE